MWSLTYGLVYILKKNCPILRNGLFEMNIIVYDTNLPRTQYSSYSIYRSVKKTQMSLEISTRPQVNVKSTKKIPCEFLSFAAVMDIFSLAIVILHVNLVWIPLLNHRGLTTEINSYSFIIINKMVHDWAIFNTIAPFKRFY